MFHAFFSRFLVVVCLCIYVTNISEFLVWFVCLFRCNINWIVVDKRETESTCHVENENRTLNRERA